MKKFFLLSVLFISCAFSQEYDVSVFLGPGKDASYKGIMDYPFHVSFDSKGNMYVVEYDGSYLGVLNTAGEFKHLGGDGTWNFREENGPVGNAQFKGLHNIIIDDEDKVYITDTFNNRCRMYDPVSGKISTYIGSGQKGFNGENVKAGEASFNELYSIAFNPDKSRIFIADLKNQRIRVMDRKTGLVSTVAGTGKKGKPVDGTAALESTFVDPRALACDSKGNIYVVDRGGHALRVIKDGKVFTLVNKAGKKGRKLGNGPDAQLAGPKYVGIDAEDRVWIADDENDRICMYDPKSKQLTAVIGKDSPLSQWETKRTHGLYIHKNGTIYVVDSKNNRILKMVKKQ